MFSGGWVDINISCFQYQNTNFDKGKSGQSLIYHLTKTPTKIANSEQNLRKEEESPNKNEEKIKQIERVKMDAKQQEPLKYVSQI